MSKRQALGAITNNLNTNVVGTFQQPLKHSASTTTLVAKQNVSQMAPMLNRLIKNENEPPQLVFATLNGDYMNLPMKKQPSEVEFEIFREEPMITKEFARSRESTLSKKSSSGDLSNKENAGISQQRQNDKPIYIDEDEEEDNDDDDDDDDDDEEDEDENDDQEDVEEEGISRLNLAAIIDNTNDCVELKSKLNISANELMVMMDSSSSTANDLTSPMVLDDTMKFQSESSHFEEIEEEEEDIDEDRKRKFDLEELDNVHFSCLEYKDDILAYMKQMELENRSKPNYMKKQQDITNSMRSILVDWLVEVSEEYKLNAETLYLAVNYTDRFLSQMSVLRGKLQLVGTASMYIASKYEEISPPDVSEFVYITDDTYTQKQVLRMEHLLLKVLDFKMTVPTINYFLTFYLRFLKLNSKIEQLARYFAELTLIDAEIFLAYTPSQIAASALYLAMHTMGKQWTKQASDLVGCCYDLSELKQCISDLHQFALQAPHHPQQAIQEKYKHAKHQHVSMTELPKTLPAFFS